ncbi:MAG: PDZ domain-containing protein [Pyrinomonadaceae bacterium MAG19_C2-C3]|nr:PDZ domain-containing protein [Pyrinomonadaceae bacterium MAG19_C2-C3]
MNCQKFKHYIDDTEARDAKDLDAIARRHLAACATCQADFAAHVKLRHLLGNLEVVPAPPDFDARLNARLTSAQPQIAAHAFFDSFRFTPSLASVALSVVFVVFLGLVLIANLPQSDTAQFQARVGNDVDNNVDTADSRTNSSAVPSAATSPVVTTASEAKVEINKPEVVALNTASTPKRTPTYKRTSTAKRITARRDALPVIPERPAPIGTADQASRASDITRVANVEANPTEDASSNITDAAPVIRAESKLDKSFERFGIYTDVEIIARPDVQSDKQTVLRVTRVRAESVAAQTDVQVGDRIEAVNDVPVGNLKNEDIEALTPPNNLRLKIRRETRRLELDLKFPE